MVPKPREPTKAEREEHELSHIPPEDWCEFCVRTKSVACPHRSSHPDERRGELQVVAMGLAFMGQQEHDELMPLLVLKEDQWGGKCSCLVLRANV